MVSLDKKDICFTLINILKIIIKDKTIINDKDICLTLVNILKLIYINNSSYGLIEENKYLKEYENNMDDIIKNAKEKNIKNDKQKIDVLLLESLKSFFISSIFKKTIDNELLEQSKKDLEDTINAKTFPKNLKLESTSDKEVPDSDSDSDFELISSNQLKYTFLNFIKKKNMFSTKNGKEKPTNFLKIMITYVYSDNKNDNKEKILNKILFKNYLINIYKKGFDNYYKNNDIYQKYQKKLDDIIDKNDIIDEKNYKQVKKIVRNMSKETRSINVIFLQKNYNNIFKDINKLLIDYLYEKFNYKLDDWKPFKDKKEKETKFQKILKDKFGFINDEGEVSENSLREVGNNFGLFTQLLAGEEVSERKEEEVSERKEGEVSERKEGEVSERETEEENLNEFYDGLPSQLNTQNISFTEMLEADE